MRTLLLFALLFGAPAARALDVPMVLSHHGLVLDSADRPVNATLDVRFAIHPRLAEAPGQVPEPIWSATYRVTFRDGLYAVLLGDLRDTASGGTALPVAVFDGGARYLGISLAGEAELEPRLQLSTVPFAWNAQRAVRADDALALGGAPAGDYLKAQLAADTYQPKGDYLTLGAAAATYQPKGDYLTLDGAGAYQPKGDYLTTSAAADAYQPKGDYLTTSAAEATYLPSAAAAAAYQPKGEYVTAAEAAQLGGGEEVYLRGSAALNASGAQLSGLAAATDGLVLATETLPELVVTSGQTFTVPNAGAAYRNITVRTGGKITAAPWDGTAGGKVVLRATGTFTVEAGASVDVAGLGYRGGVSSSSRAQHGQQGESYNGQGTRTNCTRNAGGGGGGQTDSGNYGQAGAGGGYGTQGANGVRYGVSSGCDAEGGLTYGDEDLTTLHLGSGGGSGGTDGDKGGRGGDGGRGGGAISIEAGSIVISGTIDARGQNGTNAYSESDNGGGGGGSGGSILLWATSLDLRSGSLVTVAGGNGGQPLNANVGGKGGDGRILLKGSGITTSGTITGTARKTLAGAVGPSFGAGAGTYLSPVVTLPAGTRLRQVDVLASRTPETLLAVEACVAPSAAGTSDPACFLPVASSGLVDVPAGAGAFARVRVQVVDRSTGSAFTLRAIRLLAK